MGVTSPNIDNQTDEAGRQNTVNVGTAKVNRETDLATLLKQYGSLDNLYSVLEGTQGGADATAIAGEGAAAAADQAQRYGAQRHSQIDQTLSQILADRQAAQTRADSAAYQGRLDAASGGVNNAYAGYDDGFYKNYAQKILDSQLPALQDKYQELGRTTKAGLADAGNLRGSAAARIVARLMASQTSDQAGLANAASNSAQTLRSSIDAQRQAALAQAMAAAGVQQNTPVGGATLSDILAAISKVGPAQPPAGAVLPAAPPTSVTTNPTPAPQNLPPAVQPGAAPPAPAPATVTDATDPAYVKWIGEQFQNGGFNFDPFGGGGGNLPDLSLDAYNKNLQTPASGPLQAPTLVGPKTPAAVNSAAQASASPAQQGLAPVDSVGSSLAPASSGAARNPTPIGGSLADMGTPLQPLTPGAPIDFSTAKPLPMPTLTLTNPAPAVNNIATHAVQPGSAPLLGGRGIARQSIMPQPLVL